MYPEGIAYPIGGRGQENFVVIEMHYDNQGNIAGSIIMITETVLVFAHVQAQSITLV